MSIQKKVMAIGLSFLVLGGTMTSALAYVYEQGTRYQTVTHKNIPAWGDAHYDTTYGSKKTMTLGNFAELITSSKKVVSNAEGIPLNRMILASEYGCKKGTVYFTSVSSHALEPSNTCDVTLKFSADNLY